MRMTYDAEVDAMNLRLAEYDDYSETIPTTIPGADVNLDITRDGRVIGVEVLGVKALLRHLSANRMTLAVPDKIDDPDTYEGEGLFVQEETNAEPA
jgi:uncharacterized protein YuzE